MAFPHRFQGIFLASQIGQHLRCRAMKTARVMNAAVLGLDPVFFFGMALRLGNSEGELQINALKNNRKTLEIKYHTQTALEILFEGIA